MRLKSIGRAYICGLNEVCRMFNIAKPTLKRHLRSTNKKANLEKRHFGRGCVFNAEVERQLEEHILRDILWSFHYRCSQSCVWGCRKEYAKKKQVKRKVECEDIGLPKSRKKGSKGERKKNIAKGTAKQQAEEQWFCAICKECRMENMVMCLRCNQWVHDSCTSGGNLTKYVCDNCL